MTMIKFKNRVNIKQILIIWGVVFSIVHAALVLVSISISTRDAMKGKIYQDINSGSRDLQRKIQWVDHVPTISKNSTKSSDDYYAIFLNNEKIIEGSLPEDVTDADLPQNFHTKMIETSQKTYYCKRTHLHEGHVPTPSASGEVLEPGSSENSYYLYYFIDSNELYSIYRNVARITSIATLIVVVLMIATCIIISNYLADPIVNLSKSTKDIIKTRDYSKTLDLKSKNPYREIFELSESYNHLMRQVDRTIKSQKQFNRDVSHELRTPVTVLRAQCESARKHIKNPDDLAIIDVIERQTVRISSLIGNLLNLSRVEQYSNDVPEETVSISDVVTSICDDISLVCGRDDMFELSLEDVEITANTDLILTMIKNLIENAVKYSPEDSSVEVSVFTTENSIHIEVTDHGIGMNEDEIEHIFESFYRTEDARSSEGFGLGLTLADRIAGLYDGIIQVSSKINKGSTFTVVLPLP